MTQLERAKQAVGRLTKNLEDDEAMADLEEVLGEAQNSPPQGAADGSIEPEVWNALGGLRDDLAEARSGFQWLQSKKGWTG